jgi:hypothetical protein
VRHDRSAGGLWHPAGVWPAGHTGQYADLRASISAICDYLLVPSLAVALVSGLVAMAVHAPFLDQRWAWAKALLGISMFEGTLGFVGHKATTAAEFSAKVADGAATQAELDAAIASEWQALGVVLALTVANVILGVWRPAMRGRTKPKAQEKSA